MAAGPPSGKGTSAGINSHYDAFVSYSHALDRPVAAKLQAGLHSFAKPWYRLRGLRVFRDESSLAASPGLWPEIERSLSQARTLILLASPEAVQSQWVNREIAWWVQHRSPEDFLIVRTAGQITWDDSTGDFDWSVTTAIPPSARRAFRTEPLHVDLGWARGDERLSVRDPRFQDVLASLTAPLRGQSKDELIGLDHQLHRRAVRLARAAIAAISVLALVASVLAVAAVAQRNEALTQRDNALHQLRIATARQLLAQADASEAEDPRTAVSLTLAASQLFSDTQTEAALFRYLSNSQIAGSLTGHTNPVTSVAFGPDGHTFASGSDDGRILLWDVTDPARPKQIGEAAAENTSLTSLVFSPSGLTLASGSDDGSVVLWDLTQPDKPTKIGESLLPRQDRIAAIAFSADGVTMASGGDDGSVLLWDVANLHQPTPKGEVPTDHVSKVTSLAFSSDGTLATGRDVPYNSDETVTDEAVVIFWDVRDAAHVTRIGDITTQYGSFVALSGSAQIAVTREATFGGLTDADDPVDESIVFWDIRNPVLPARIGGFPTGMRSTIWTAAFSADERVFATGSFSGTIVLWDVHDPGQPVRMGPPLVGHTAAVSFLAFSVDGHTFASAGSDGSVILWNVVNSAQPIRNGPPLIGHSGRVTGVAFSPAGGVQASVSDDGTLVLWDVDEPLQPKMIGGPVRAHSGAVMSVAFSADGKALATTGVDGVVVFWEFSEASGPRRLAKEIAVSDKVGTSIAFSPTAPLMATGTSDGRIFLWDVTDVFRPTRIGVPLSGHTRGVLLAFSKDGSTLVSGSLDSTISLWNVTDPRHATRIAGPLVANSDGVLTVAFNPNGEMIASGGADGRVLLWDVANPAKPNTFATPLTTGASADVIWSVAFSADGRTVAVSDLYRDEVTLWDITDPTRPTTIGQPLEGTSGGSHAVAFNTNGQTLVTGGSDGTVSTWDLTGIDGLHKQLAQRACAVTGGGLTQDEWSYYVTDIPFQNAC